MFSGHLDTCGLTYPFDQEATCFENYLWVIRITPAMFLTIELHNCTQAAIDRLADGLEHFLRVSLVTYNDVQEPTFQDKIQRMAVHVKQEPTF